MGAHDASSRGDRGPAAADGFEPALYDELRRLAAWHMRLERPDHTLRPTALVHEAYVRLAEQRVVPWDDRARFMGLASSMMRRVLVDHARRRATEKRGGGITSITLDEDMAIDEKNELGVVALDEALSRLAERDERQAKVVEMRFFGGLEVVEVAELLGVSPTTVKRDWRFARAWLTRELSNRRRE